MRCQAIDGAVAGEVRISFCPHRRLRENFPDGVLPGGGIDGSDE